ncbi:MAG: universal stress protein [Betaproteobacteria bacterium]|nr:universal stress protein [Betaproteobacteria bacterium]
MKILLAVDGSEISLRAVRSLVDHVQWFANKPEVHLLTVQPPIPVGLATQHVGHDALERYYREEGESMLASARQLLDAASLPHTPHIHVGEPAAIIVKLAGELDCDLICMGSHGHGALQNAILGSVATRVLHLSRVPVLLAK